MEKYEQSGLIVNFHEYVKRLNSEEFFVVTSISLGHASLDHIISNGFGRHVCIKAPSAVVGRSFSLPYFALLALTVTHSNLEASKIQNFEIFEMANHDGSSLMSGKVSKGWEVTSGIDPCEKGIWKQH